MVVGGVGLAMTGLAIGENRGIDGSSSGKEIDGANERIRAYNIAAISCYAVAGAALTSYLIWRFWPNRRIRIAAIPTPRPSLSIGGTF